MKKYIYLLLLLNCVPVMHVNAQKDDLNKFRLGVRTSPSLNWISTGNIGWDKNSVTLGITYGIICEFSIINSSNYMFSTGLQFSNIGGKISYPTILDTGTVQSSIIASSATAKYKLKYLDIPLMLKLRTNEIGYLHYFLSFGVITGINISAKRNINYSIPNFDLSRSIENENVKKDIFAFRGALSLDAGIEYKINGKTFLIIGLFYQSGFSNILKGYTYKLNSDNNIIINNNAAIKDRKILTKLNSAILSLGIIF